MRQHILAGFPYLVYLNDTGIFVKSLPLPSAAASLLGRVSDLARPPRVEPMAPD